MAVLVILIAVVGTVFLVKNFPSSAQAETDYLRIHVRANSNSQTDQSIKYKVKDEVVRFITPYAAQCTDKEKAMEIIKEFPTPFHIYDEKGIRENTENVKKHFHGIRVLRNILL